ncbi:Glycosyltransferase family 25 (LPS biosynthesis protein) [Kaistia soli DSM 19436]|uniref:Glycosyltransferase family 25 (LPS biosynthesis protein) n=1 Tax=Kaistia soli DSM 19436 TaxID=1122133 RepID=A0A1M5P080_9HYPH|nr:glycosyltransferase family 25 protein [Kaistia soli]SHG94839.1 Glycosyltransferase family 25 (LPS biosynthesis protein) [Kaistia soli DSM 19436]
MKTIVISLPHRVDRRDTFEAWNKTQPLAFSFLPAAEGDRIARHRLIESGLLDEGEYNFGPGALGNALSHAAIWRNCAEGTEPYLIFEDDACLRGDFWKHAKPILERNLAACDVIVLGYNTDSVVALRGSDGVVSAMRFDETVKKRPGYFESYSRLHDVRPNLFRCVQFWGLLAYAITPASAKVLLSTCLPLSSREEVTLIGEDRVIRPYGMDSMFNLALQKGMIRAAACYPALALGPNNQMTSDIQTTVNIQLAC